MAIVALIASKDAVNLTVIGNNVPRVQNLNVRNLIGIVTGKKINVLINQNVGRTVTASNVMTLTLMAMKKEIFFVIKKAFVRQWFVILAPWVVVRAAATISV